MRVLSTRISGEYLDAFLYRGHIYLLCVDSRLEIINWDEMMKRAHPSPYGDIDPLAEVLFVNNSLSYHSSLFDRLAQDPSIRNVLQDKLDSYKETNCKPNSSETFTVDLDGLTAHTLELYYSHVWLAGENGAYVLQCGPGYRKKRSRSKITTITHDRTYTVVPDRRFAWLSQPGCTLGFPLEDMSTNRVGVAFGRPWELNYSALSVGWHWSDPAIVSRDDFSTRIFVRAHWLEEGHDSSSLPSNAKQKIVARKAAAAQHQIGDPIRLSDRQSYIEIDLGGQCRGRLFCSRERAILQRTDTLIPSEWHYDLSFDFKTLRGFGARADGVERVLLSTFGWVAEHSDSIEVFSRHGRSSLVESEVVQVRSFPSSIRYENIVIVVFDDRVEVLALADYDFLNDPRSVGKRIGRRSEYFARRPDDSRR